MPLFVQLYGGAIRLRPEGAVDFDELQAGFQRALAQAVRSQSSAGEKWDVLIDATKCTAKRTADEIKSLAHFFSCNRSVLTGRCAIVAVDAYHFGIARQFATYAEDHGLEVHICNTAEQAIELLGAPLVLD